MRKFTREDPGHSYIFETCIDAGDTVIVETPRVSPNKRSVNDIGWQSDGDITLYGTLSGNPENETSMWQEIKPGENINKTVSAFKIVNNSDSCRIAIRMIMA